MATYTAKRLKFIEQGDFMFKVGFIHRDKYNLETQELSKSTSDSDCLSAIKDTIVSWEENAALTNYESVKSQYDGKNVDITVDN